ncbi:MAG: M23 family metallopeptidase [Clostridia bacterium]|nr:M23 family metallopeptidase [Clostridia bacterium]
MKEQNEKRALDKKNYLYVALGVAAVLLALIVIITSVALAGRKNNQLAKPPQDSTVPGTSDSGSDGGSDSGSSDKPVITPPTEFVSPVATVNAINGYGFYHNQTLNNYYVHTGVDFATDEGTEVYAAQSGTVEGVYTSDVLVGTRIVIDHGDGVKTVYEFVEAKEGLKAGDRVERGDVIATVSAPTGNEYKDGAHLHFEVMENGTAVDPSEYLTLEEK